MRARTLNGDAGDLVKAGLATAGAAAAGPVGAAAGNAIGNIIGNLFGAGPSSWDDAGAAVHDWFTRFGEQAYLDWARGNEPRAFANVDAAKGYYLLWDHNKYNRWNYLQDGNRSPSNLVEYFAAQGIDLRKSQANAINRSGQSNTLLPQDMVMLPNAGPAALPTPVVDQIVADAAAGDPKATDAASAILKDAPDPANPDKPKDNSMLLLGGLAIAAFMLHK